MMDPGAEAFRGDEPAQDGDDQGKSILVVLDTGLALYFMMVSRSSFVVKARMIGGGSQEQSM